MLWITPKWPLPPQDGARKATFQLLRELSTQGHAIDLLSIAGDGELKLIDVELAKRELGIRTVHIVRRPENGSGVPRLARALGSLVTRPGVPITFRNYSSPRLSREIDDLVARAEIVVYDGLHPAAHRLRNGLYEKLLPGPRVIYRAHNFEADIWKRKAELSRNPVFRAFFAHQADRIENFERSLASRADGLATVSEDDLAVFQRDPELPSERCRVVPIGYDFKSPDPFRPSPNPLRLLFLGRLDWPPNQEGIIWFLREVWPEVLRTRQDLALDIAGSGDPSAIRPWIDQGGVKFLGRVDSVEAVYLDSHLALAPIFYGSGTRVKVIEAACHGRACLSTALGVEGTGLRSGESYLRAETASDWIRALRDLGGKQAETLGLRAFESLKQTFDVRKCARDFGQLVENERV